MTILNNKVVFVAGGAGNIGGNIVRGLLRAGATVTTASRDRTRFDRLERFIASEATIDTSKLITLVGDVGDTDGAQKLYGELDAGVGTPDIVVASLGGGMNPQPLTEMPLDIWEDVLRNNLTSHFVAARSFLPPMLARGSGVYLLVSGYGGEVAWENSAPISVSAAGVTSLGRNLSAETKKSGVRVKTMVLTTSPQLWSKFEGKPGAYRGEDVGDFMAWLASDESQSEKEDVLHYITDWNKANVMRQF